MFATAKLGGLFRLFGREHQRFDRNLGVRPIAKGLFAAKPARAPEIGATAFKIGEIGAFLGPYGICHNVFYPDICLGWQGLWWQF